MKTKKKIKATAGVTKEKGRIGRTVGVQSGKGVTDTWSLIFRTNAKKKLTDEQILSRMKREFPQRKHFQPVGRVRSFFNRGVQGYGNPPGKKINNTPKKSVPYDTRGRVTSNSHWASDHKPDPTMAKLARKRALKQWASGHGKKPKSKKPVVKKAKPASVKISKGGGKGGKIKLKVTKKAA